MAGGTFTKWTARHVPSLEAKESGQNSRAPSYTLTIAKGGKGTNLVEIDGYTSVPDYLVGAYGYLFSSATTDPNIAHAHALYTMTVDDARCTMTAASYSSTGHIITITFATAHGWVVGDHVSVRGFTPSLPDANGDWFLTAVTEFTISYSCPSYPDTPDTPLTGVTAYTFGDTSGRLVLLFQEVMDVNLAGGSLTTLYPTDGFDFSDVSWWYCDYCRLPYRKSELIRHPREGKFVCRKDYNKPGVADLQAYQDYRGEALNHAAELYRTLGEWP